MRHFSLLFWAFFVCNVLATPLLTARGYQKGSGYRKFDKDRELAVTKTMVKYWSRPDVLPYLPTGVKEKVEEWIQKFPQWYYQPPQRKSPSKSSKASETHVCKTQ
jgi:hypothetical protein